MKTLYFAVIMILTGISCLIISITSVYATCPVDVDCGNGYRSSQGNSPIIISGGPFSSGSQVNILIHAPDFNSNPYAIDSIGEDGNKVIISTRESSIPYRLVETGSDTGDFAGYIILSSTTSTCSPVCGPTDGFLAAGGDDAVTVSFTYAGGRTISASSYEPAQSPTTSTIPEFPLAGFELLVGMMSLFFFTMKFIR
jgi:hypothetical protein